MSDFDALLKKAEKLDVPVDSGIYKPKSEAWQELNIGDYELKRRINEEERHRRENRLFWIALFSSGASIVSAVIALIAVLNGAK